MDVAFGPGGIIAVADYGSHRVEVFHANGMFACQLGSGEAGTKSDRFSRPTSVAFGPGGIIAVADYGSHRVEVFNPPRPVAPPAMPSGSQSFTGAALAFEFGSYGSGPGHLMAPRNVAYGPGGLMAVADTGNHRVQVFSPDGTYAFAFGSRGMAQASSIILRAWPLAPAGCLPSPTWAATASRCSDFNSGGRPA